MERIKMQNPIAELDGDEMTRVIWHMIKEELILPFVELNTEYYDLSLPNREKTRDAVTVEAADAIKRLKIGVKCATITPNLQRKEEYGLSELWRSPNATIRAALDGTVFRAPILISKVKPVVSCWKRPITIARHAYGDLYRAVEYRVQQPGKAELVFTDEDGRELSRQTVYHFRGSGVVQAMHNRDDSILSFARCCFAYALDVKQDVWFSAKDTISKDYDQTFKLLFQKVFDEEYRSAFEQAGLHYRYALIDDVAAKVIRSSGGIIWACKNYDGDVMSDLVAAAAGSLPMMTSVLVSPDGCFEYEAAHGTVTDHFYRYRRGEKVSTNPLATIAAWSGALKKRGELDGNAALMQFAELLGRAGIDVFEQGYLSEDLAALCDPEELVEMPDNPRIMALIRKRLEELLAAA
ncbi:isocitrate dehydrogenase [NADP] [Clostridium sp. CAG:1024]|jgi:isocitrate dehydrogenase|nr:NADP-dependent isocitrate dehydrogenase [Clostridium sp.]MDD7139119.1 NADP-dependent isocitrate dehydrogenase [Clostridium sp.]MDY6082157.1 NADP-dependent isocitrate dehydrogenase [Eubacteriales bacterium]CCX41382.1 isocitrate dehydrogenase [NADP] [Clostridium sp. CAG:1024]